MTLSEYERRLQSVNPRLRIRRICSGMANVYLGTSMKPLARVDTGELTLYNQFKYAWGKADQYKTPLNTEGHYKFKLMIKRGRAELARVLHTQHAINYSDISKLS